MRSTGSRELAELVDKFLTIEIVNLLITHTETNYLHCDTFNFYDYKDTIKIVQPTNLMFYSSEKIPIKTL
jgi:hypothetical protein